jgi:hypothetical protein
MFLWLQAGLYRIRPSGRYDYLDCHYQSMQVFRLVSLFSYNFTSVIIQFHLFQSFVVMFEGKGEEEVFQLLNPGVEVKNLYWSSPVLR